MTTIVTKANTQAYAIYVDNRKIVECQNPETTYNELVKNIGIDTTNVQIVEMDSFPATLNGQEPQGTVLQNIVSEVIEERTVGNIDDIINAVNSTTTAPNINKYKGIVERQSSGVNQPVGVPGAQSNEPVGNVEVPKLGDLVYVDGLDGILRKITGGVGTVHMVYNAQDRVEVGVKTVENPDYDPEDEDSESTIDVAEIGSNILIELEEIPGIYYQWSFVKDKQKSLKDKYGYKPVCAIN
jgi:hypothetical protein